MNWKNRLSCIFLLGMLSLLVSCGGGTSGAGSSEDGIGLPASGTVSGVAHDNVLIGSTITVRNFAGGKAGTILGTGKTDQSGNYSITINSDSTPLIIEASGGSYVEEASGISVNLGPTQMLRAVINYTEGSAVDVSITPYTNLAAGLAAYRVKKSSAPDASAIDAANQEISNWLGFNLISVKPRDITNVANVTSGTADDYSYGLIGAAISSWTKFAASKSGQQHAVLSSVVFADSMYQDVVADGSLDGNGLDATGAVVPISFGSIALSRDVYRYALAAHVVQIANDTSVNKTGLTESAVLPFAKWYAANTGSFWNAVAPLPFSTGRPAINITVPVLNQVVRGTAVPVSAIVAGLGSVEWAILSIDNQTVGTPVSTANPTFIFNSKNYGDINHVLKITVLDSFGITASQSLTVAVDNATPTVGVDFTSPLAGSTVRGPSVTVYGNVSQGAGTAASATLSFDGIVVGTAANPNSPTFTFNSIGYSGSHTFTLDVIDSFNIHTSKMIAVTVDNVTPTVVISYSSPASNAWVSGTSVGVVASVSGLGLPVASASFSIDGDFVSSSPADPTNPNFVFNSKNYADGAHTLKIDVVDSFGIPATQTSTVRVDNTPPTSTLPGTLVAGQLFTGTATDAGSGVSLIRNLDSGLAIVPVAGNWTWVNSLSYTSSSASFEVRDQLGNCNQYRSPIVIARSTFIFTGWTIVKTGYSC